MTFAAYKENRSQRTREALISSAETLFARYGVEGVSLNTITREAGQSNRNAVQYHFGNKAGLLQAIFDKHNPGLHDARAQLVADLQSRGIPRSQVIARALVEPLLEKLADPNGGEAFVHISAELITDNTLGYLDQDSEAIRLKRESTLSKIVHAQLQPLPTALATQRVLFMNGLVFHSLSDYTKLIRKSRNLSSANLPQSLAFMSGNLIDCIEAMLQAPASANTLATLSELEQKA